jgi:uncharacterized lipoprotein YmbA
MTPSKALGQSPVLVVSKALGRLPAVLLALGLAGCAATAPAPVLLTLPPATSAPAASGADRPPGAEPAPRLVVRRVAIPEYLVARRVRYRAEASTLAEWPNTYWAERIEIGVSREFGAALRARLAGWTVCDTGCGDQTPTLTLEIELAPMDYLRAAQRLEAHARVTLHGPVAGAKPLRIDELSFTVAGDADTPQAQARTIASLLQQLAASIPSMVAQPPRR